MCLVFFLFSCHAVAHDLVPSASPHCGEAFSLFFPIDIDFLGKLGGDFCHLGPDVAVCSSEDFNAPDVPVGGDQTLEHQRVVEGEVYCKAHVLKVQFNNVNVTYYNF